MCAGEPVFFTDVAMAGNAHADGKFNRLLVEPRQGAGVPEGNGTDMCIGCAPKKSGITTKQLRVGEQLGMHFEPDYQFIFFGQSDHPANVQPPND